MARLLLSSRAILFICASCFVRMILKKESESTPILPDSKQSNIDLNQFINLTRYKDMRKFSLEELFYSKKFNRRVNNVVMEVVSRLVRKQVRTFFDYKISL